MWVEFIVDSLVCSERFLSRYSLQKPTFPNFDSISGIATSKTLFIYLFTYLFIKDLFHCIIQSMPRRKPLPVIRKVNISPYYVMFENDALCSIAVDPQEQVTFADVVKERCWVAVGHNGFFGFKVTT